MVLGSRLEFLFSSKQIPPQNEITCEAVSRVFERCRFVLFKEEMAYPSEAVSYERNQDEQAGIVKYYRCGNKRNNEAGSNEMQNAAGRVAMLFQIKLVEIFKRGNAGFLHTTR